MSLLDDAIREHLELMRRRGADAADVARAERDALGIRSPEEEAREAAAAAGIIPANPASDPAADETQIARPAPAPSSAPYEEAPDFGRDAEAVPPVEAPPAIEPSIDVPVGEILHDARADPEPPAAPEPVAEPDPEPAAEVPAPVVEDPEVVERASQSTVAFSPDEVAAATAAEEAAHAASAPEPEPAPAAAAPEAPAPAHEDADFVYERDPEPQEEAPEASAPAAPAAPTFEPEPTREHPAPAPREPEPREPAPEPAAEEPAPAADGEPEDVLEETPDFLQETPEHDRLWFEQRPPRDFDF